MVGNAAQKSLYQSTFPYWNVEHFVNAISRNYKDLLSFSPSLQEAPIKEVRLGECMSLSFKKNNHSSLRSFTIAVIGNFFFLMTAFI